MYFCASMLFVIDRTPASASAADTLSFQIVRTLDNTEQTTLRDILTNTTQTPL